METVHQTEMVNREGNMGAKKFTTILDMLDRYQDSEKIALICGKEQLAYRELIADARHIARGLLAAGVQKGGRVLFSMHRKADAIRALFGILYAGASYVAADPEWPKVRMEFVQRDAQTVFAMTDETCRSLREKEPSAAELPKVTGEDEVAVYYTSGSMGQPKGVVLQHIAFGSTFWGTHVYAQRGTIFQCIYKFTYVVATIHLFAVLSKGKTLLLSTDAEECCAELLAAAMERHCADAIAGTPSVLLRFLEDSSFARAFAGVKCVSLSGERIHPSVAQRLSKFAKGCVLSYYGTSEMAGCAEYCYENDSKIHLGNAAYGVRLHLLDETMEEIPSGGEGELFIGGIPAKYGHYLNRPDLDAEKYVEHLRLGRLFRTGDLARLETDGEITLLGRKDSMVKLHGQRIEIGEVEDAMVSFPGIRRTAVRLLGESPHEMLAGYYTADGEVSEAELRQHLADRLPHYMVPALFMKLKAMPENANGKLDYRALPPIELPKEEYVPPETAREKVLCEFFAQVLKLKDLVVGVNDSFFALGGDSIAGMQLIGLLMERYNISCTMNQLVIHPTPAALAQILSEASVKKEQSQRAASYQIRNYPRSLEGILEDSHIEAALPVNGSTTAFLYMKQEGIRDRFNTSRLQIKIGASWRDETFRARVSALVKNHPALRSFFHRDENGKYWQIIRSTNETPVWFKNISYLAPEAAETFVRGFWQVMEGEEALFAAACFVWDAKTILLVQADHTIADGMSMHIIANELAAESYQDLPVDGYIAHRKRTLGSREDITPFILDYYGKGNPSFSSVDPMSLGDQGIRRETVALSRQDTERFSQNCAAAGILPYSMVFYCYGQAILSVSEIDEVWLMMLDSGRYAEWGDELRIVGNIVNGMPVRIARGMTAQEFQKDLLCLRECHHLQDSVLLYDRKWNRIPEGIISNDFVELDPVIESLEILGDDKRRGNSMELLDGCLTIRLRHADLEPVSEWYQKVAKELSLRLQAACK